MFQSFHCKINYNIKLLEDHCQKIKERRDTPDSKVHGANMGPTWALSALDGLHIGPMNPSSHIINVAADDSMDVTYFAIIWGQTKDISIFTEHIYS